MKEITKEMIAQHQLVNRILLDFEKTSKEDTDMMIEIFNLFKDNWTKHMLLEEAHIFPVTDKSNPIETKELNLLLKDHKDLKEIIINFEEDINSGTKPDTKVFREMLVSHEQREVQSFYPLLDKRLSVNVKQKILNDIKNVKLG